MTDVSIAAAVAAGALSFLSPCVLALLPVYLAFLGDTAGTAPSGGAAATRTAVLPQALLFVGGFSLLFIVLGTSIGLIGAPLFRIPEARQVAGIVVIGLGVVTTGVFGPVLDRLNVGFQPSALPVGRSLRSLTLGAFVAVGWTPCIGPVLGAILTMGASTGSAPVVALLLTAYSIGLAVPFLVAAVAFPRIRPLVELLRQHHRAVQVVSGLLIVAIGVLIYLNAFARLATLFT
ncbi:MAG TPA: cytochrome c biogenesis protein CcdA, partial [Candidatus Limnocylindria bacterium]|nr:cytochrome c biogenesis protein CcdA [Candidatus Limnocylindria bacterium]